MINFTCSINLAKSVHNALRPDSSNILSNVISCKATRVVSNMSRPAWFANMNTGNDCNIKWRRIMLISLHKNWRICHYKNILFQLPLWKTKGSVSTQFTLSEQHRIASWWCHRCFSIMSPARESDLSKSDLK